MTERILAKVDDCLCVGNAMCRAAAPRAFVEGAGGQSEVAEPWTEDIGALLEAAANCPVGAITVFDPETGESIEPHP